MDLLDHQLLQILERLIPFLHLYQHRCLHIRQPNIETPWLTKQRFVARGAAAVAVANGVVLGISLGFNDHAPEQAAVVLAFHQQAAHQRRSNDFRRAAEEGVGKGWEVLSDGLVGYGSGLQTCLTLAQSF